MMDIRLTSFVLGLLFVLQALRDSSAYAHQGEERVVEKGNEVAVQKALFNGVNAAHLKKTGLGGRKMAGQKVLSTEIGRGDMLNGGTSELSGKDSTTLRNSPGGSRDTVDDQNIMHMLRPKASKSASLGIPRSEPAQLPNTNSEHTQDSKALPTRARVDGSPRSDKTVSRETYDTSRKNEDQRLLEATRKIVNLMHKDYGRMAHRKPPINNHEPRD